MTEREQSAILTLCFMAVATDGTSELEQSEIRRIADRAPNPNIQLDRLYQEVLQRKQSLAEVVSQLVEPDTGLMNEEETREAGRRKERHPICSAGASKEGLVSEQRWS
ncbi:MAG: hypothetical protein FJ147_23595 [Deltaproteobacteria bacterium]|nr:hypothetical protein [Deltaproteobacteria bacterium]